MMSFTGIKRALAVFLAATTLLLVGCGKTDNPQTQPSSNTAKNHNLTFVVADKTNWDKEINIGDYTYTLAVSLKENGTLELVGTCTGRYVPQQSGNQGGSGGGEETQPTEPPATLPPLTQSEKDALKFTQTGTWEYEKGYGYNITLNNYSTKTNYDKASSRHYFYAEVVKDGASLGLLEFMAKDTSFRNDIAADYQEFELRDAAYVFELFETNTGNNPNSTRLYLLKDGTASSLVYQGSSGTYKRGTWVKNADNSLTVTIGGENYDCDYCDIAGKEGYRVKYNSKTMYSNGNVTYTDVDFNGEVVKTLQCAEQDYTLELTEKGFAVLRKDGEAKVTGKYTEKDGVYTVTLDGKTFISDGETITVEFTEQSSNSSSGGGESATRTFNLDGSVPSGGQSGGSEGGEQPGGSEGGEQPGGSEGGEG